MAYQALLLSDRYSLDYQEVGWKNRRIPTGYDFYVFNYHELTSMSWLDTRCIRELPGLKTTLVLEVSPNNPFVLVSPVDFDAYLVLDPTIDRINSRVYAFPRPLEQVADLPAYAFTPRPVIGTFGLPTAGKGFDKLILAVNREFESALVRMNIPALGDHSSQLPRRVDEVIKICRSLAKPGVEVVITHDFMSKPDLIRWCAGNTLNCFLYDRSLPGLAATTDQAIASGRPLAVSANETFRHLHDYLTPYPLRSLKESIAISQGEVEAMRQAWSPVSFARKFDEVLEERKVVPQESGHGWFTLRSKQSRFAFIPKIYRKIKRRLSRKQPGAIPPVIPYANPLISSSSQWGEDLWLDLFLSGKATGFYVDVGAGDPKFNSNTNRFYARGWSGINIEPTSQGHGRLLKHRTRDINLQVAVGPGEGGVVLYGLSHDAALSTLSREQAERMAQSGKLAISETTVPALPLSEIFRRHLDGRTIDFLSVDVEGREFEVLGSNDWNQVRPTFVIVDLTQQSDAIKQLMNKADYMLLINNSSNGIFVDATNRSPEVNKLLPSVLGT